MGIEISEKQFEAQIKDLAKIYSWKYYHTWKSIHSPAGFPDIVMVRPPRLIFAELKSEKGKTTLEQEEWMNILRECSLLNKLLDTKTIVYVSSTRKDVEIHLEVTMPEVYLFRPSEFDKIVEILKR